MHLGLVDRPFVTHNVISTQESPIPLLKFDMAPRLKIVIASESKKGTQLYFSFLSKVPENEPSSRFPNRAPMERVARLQGTLHISRKPHLLGSRVKEPFRFP
jgi:hypothetical protein